MNEKQINEVMGLVAVYAQSIGVFANEFLRNGEISDSPAKRRAQKDWEAIRAKLGEFAGWQPIETAPKDGTSVIVFGPTDAVQYDGGICVASWTQGGWGTPEYYQPTPAYWQPLPEPPCEHTS